MNISYTKNINSEHSFRKNKCKDSLTEAGKKKMVDVKNACNNENKIESKLISKHQDYKVRKGKETK